MLLFVPDVGDDQQDHAKHLEEKEDVKVAVEVLETVAECRKVRSYSLLICLFADAIIKIVVKAHSILQWNCLLQNYRHVFIVRPKNSKPTQLYGDTGL